MRTIWMAAGLVALVLAAAPNPAAAAVSGDQGHRPDMREKSHASPSQWRRVNAQRLARANIGLDEDDYEVVGSRRYEDGDADRPRYTKRRSVRHARRAVRHHHASRRALRRTAHRALRTVHRADRRRYVSTGSATRGVASYYYQGRFVASGARFNPDGLTAAHRTLPFGTRVRVTHLGNGRSVNVVINDRGPFAGGRVIDLSRGAARVIGMIGQGLAQVSLTILGR